VLLASEPLDGLAPGAPVLFASGLDVVRPSDAWLGRVIDAFAEPLDGKGPLRMGGKARPVRSIAPNAQSRARVDQRMGLGVKSIDVFAPCARGQRLGVFAGSGVGKSTIMSMLARGAEADVIVIGLIGERGREVREFIEDTLGQDGLAKSVIVTATSDEAAPKRRRAAWLTLAVAEHFRDEGKQVSASSTASRALQWRSARLVLPPESRRPRAVTRLPCSPNCPSCLSARGRVSRWKRASHRATSPACSPCWWMATITTNRFRTPCAVFSMAISRCRAHIAERGRFPAVDVLKSISRLQNQLQTPQERDIARKARKLIALYSNMEELVRIGAYAKGADAEVDEAVRLWPQIEAFLQQDVHEVTTIDGAFEKLLAVLTPPAPAQAAPRKVTTR
jgi:flagellum-specific ATP synthase